MGALSGQSRESERREFERVPCLVRCEVRVGEDAYLGRAVDVSPRGLAVRGEISVLPALADRVPADALLFIIARSPGGGPPLAVKRIENPELPFRFAIGPDDDLTVEPTVHVSFSLLWSVR